MSTMDLGLVPKGLDGLNGLVGRLACQQTRWGVIDTTEGLHAMTVTTTNLFQDRWAWMSWILMNGDLNPFHWGPDGLNGLVSLLTRSKWGIVEGVLARDDSNNNNNDFGDEGTGVSFMVISHFAVSSFFF